MRDRVKLLDGRRRVCVAHLDPQPARHAARGARCGSTALDWGDVRIAGQLVELALCRVHFRKLRDSPDPAALAHNWAPAPNRVTLKASTTGLASASPDRPGDHLTPAGIQHQRRR
jgi:hypothetical protein